MKVSFPFAGQTLPDEYGINQPAEQLIDGINLRSLPFTVTELPKETTHLAFSVIDYDTIPVVGYPWIHWLVADVAVTQSTVTVPADASQTADLLQGTNSMANIVETIQTPADFTGDLTRCYTGPRPRGGIHQYRVDLYALREPLKLAPGFLYNTFLEKLDGRLCQQAHAYLAYARK